MVIAPPLLLVFAAGVLGSSHCIGMCGPFALILGAGADWRTNLLRQAAYTCGRVFTYGVFGAVAGFGGWQLGNSVPALRNSAAILAIAAGLFLLYQGLRAAGVLGGAVKGGEGPCLAGSFLTHFLKSSRLGNVFLAGLFTGMLPCGLVYAFLALAASTANVLAGAALMAVFGLGTAPVMMLTGLGASLVSHTMRKRIYQFAAWSVVVAGLLSIARGAGFVEVPGWKTTSHCPGCTEQTASPLSQWGWDPTHEHEHDAE